MGTSKQKRHKSLIYGLAHLKNNVYLSKANQDDNFPVSLIYKWQSIFRVSNILLITEILPPTSKVQVYTNIIIAIFWFPASIKLWLTFTIPVIVYILNLSIFIVAIQGMLMLIFLADQCVINQNLAQLSYTRPADHQFGRLWCPIW